MKKVIISFAIAVILFAYSFANTETNEQTKNKGVNTVNYTVPASTLVTGPFTSIWIGIRSAFMIPVGFFQGATQGATESAKLSDNPLIKVSAGTVGAATGAVSGAINIPMQTSAKLTQEATEKGYIA